MLLTEEALVDRLRELAADCDAIDMATAWASPGEALQVILEMANTGDLRAIVGIAGSATHPTVLREIAKVGNLRIPRKAPLFHPKLILFHRGNRTTGWIGSANMTRSGYEQNVEIMLEFEDDGSARDWFDKIWKGLDEDTSAVIKEYESEWAPGKAFRDPAADLDDDVAIPSFEGILPQGADWRTYVQAIRGANRFWKEQGVHWTVDGEGASWLTTVKLGNSIILREDLRDITYLEYRVLMGIGLKDDESGYGLLGSMVGAGDAKKVFHPKNREMQEIRQGIRRLLQPVIDANFDDFPDAASDFIQKISAIQGFSGSVATRLATLARPDLGISVNDGSTAMLRDYSGIRASALKRPRRTRGKGSYAELIEFMQHQPWYRSPDPKNRYERTIAASRGALLDSLAYGYGWHSDY